MFIPHLLPNLRLWYHYNTYNDKGENATGENLNLDHHHGIHS